MNSRNVYHTYDPAVDGDETDGFVTAYREWEESAHRHNAISQDFGKQFRTLWQKCHELETECLEQKKTVKLWQQEGRKMERELNYYKSAAVRMEPRPPPLIHRLTPGTPRKMLALPLLLLMVTAPSLTKS